MSDVGAITHMRREIDEIPQAVARLSGTAAQAQLSDAAAKLKALDPPALITVARGSSDHAVSYLKYAIELRLGLPVASVGPSIASVYKAQLRSRGLGVLAVSQSGASTDIGLMAKMLRADGGLVTALTNTPDSPLAKVVDQVVDVAAGPENAVAATKSFVNSVVAGVWLVGLWAGDSKMIDALNRLPDRLAARQVSYAFDDASACLERADRAVVIARGAGLGLAQEMALKLLETCRIHASAYSGAEVLHGPSALLTDGYPVVALTTGGEAGVEQAIERISGQGARVVRVPEATGTGHPLVDPILDMPPFYAMVEALSRARGANPDAPAHLMKETKTV